MTEQQAKRFMDKYPAIADLKEKAKARIPHVAWQYLETGTGLDLANDRNQEALSRRGFMGGVLAFGTGAFLLGTSALTPATAGTTDRFGFDAVPASTEDTVAVPKGFSWHPVVKWGDPLWSNGAEFDQATRGTAESQALAFGDNNDGMSLFAHDGKSILAR